MLAANVDQAAVVIAGEPRFDEELLVRVLIAVEAAGVPALVISNKSDLVVAHRAIAPRIDVLRRLDYHVVETAARTDPDASRERLLPMLAGRTTVLLGQSGMGKSTLLNLLVPGASQATGEVSAALRAGRHTTTSSRLFELEAIAPDTRLIDTPGFQSFGLAYLSESEKTHAMREFATLIGRCRFHSCTHRTEPGCAIRDAVDQGLIDKVRYRLFVSLFGRA